MRPQLTIEAFADWCSKQPAEKTYPFIDANNCACAQYAGSLGIEEWVCRSPFWKDAEDIAMASPWTFGALTARLRLSL